MEHHLDFEPIFTQKDDKNFEECYEKIKEFGTLANHCEMYTTSMVTRTNIHVQHLKGQVSQIYNFDSSNTPTLHVSYHDINHYNSLCIINNNVNVLLAPMLLEEDNQSTCHFDKNLQSSLQMKKGAKIFDKMCEEDKLLKRQGDLNEGKV